MTSSRQLYSLQERDLALDARREALATVIAQLQDNQRLRQAQQALDRARQELAGLEQSQRQAEWASDDQRAKIAKAEEKLYSGRIGNPKELLGLHEEVASFRGHLREAEDRLLEVMLQVDAARQQAEECHRQFQETEKSWQQEQARLSRERATLEAEVADLEAERQSLQAGVAAEVLDLYSRLRAQRQGQAVAKVQGGMCQGCRIVVPTHQWQQARSGETLVQCNSCGRILYVS